MKCMKTLPRRPRGRWHPERSATRHLRRNMVQPSNSKSHWQPLSLRPSVSAARSLSSLVTVRSDAALYYLSEEIPKDFNS